MVAVGDGVTRREIGYRNRDLKPELKQKLKLKNPLAEALTS